LTDKANALRVSAYADDNATEWDEFIAEAPMATFLHSRRFLSHHGTRFADQSLMLRDKQSRVVAVFPAAKDPADDETAISHPGITYGGLIHTGSLSGRLVIEALTTICDYYTNHAVRLLRYKAVPHIYHRRPSEDDLYALTSLGARLYRCDLSCAIDLADRPRPSQRRRRGQRKAKEHGVEVAVDAERLADFWAVLEQNLASRHGVRPTHSLHEMQLLFSRFPDSIHLVTAQMDRRVVAGVVLFTTQRVVHTQYIAATDEGRAAYALDATIESCIELASTRGAHFFDFGISTEAEGTVLNDGLHRFKSEFGGGGIVHLFYELALTHRRPLNGREHG
jgi:hypothetical protein